MIQRSLKDINKSKLRYKRSEREEEGFYLKFNREDWGYRFKDDGLAYINRVEVKRRRV